MKQDRDLLRLRHILVSIERIETVTKDIDLNIFTEDWKIQDIVIRNLEIVGEASRHITSDLKSKYPEVAWSEANALRNVLIHEYFGVSAKQIWLTVQGDIPLLKEQITQILADLSQDL